MDERDQPETDKPAGDLVEDGAEEPREPWLVTVGHSMGLAARLIRNAAGQVGGLFRRPAAPVEKKARVDTAALLRELGEQVSQHADGAYATLAEDEQFWKLVRQLSRQGPRRWRRRLPAAAATAAERAVAGEGTKPEQIAQESEGTANVADTMALLGLSPDAPAPEQPEGEAGDEKKRKKKSKGEEGE
jgi:hypothetical protein